jgi:hypothetical protein
MATYREIKEYVKNVHGKNIETCWIAEMKELLGLKPKIAHNRLSVNSRSKPCPENRKQYIKDAFKHYNMI